MRKKLFIVIGLLLSVAAALWLVWYFWPTSEEEQAKNDIMLMTETRYVVSVDSVDIMAFRDMRADTLMNGIVSASRKIDADGRKNIPAQWVRRCEWLPYCGGTLAVENFDTAKVCRLNAKQVRKLMEREAGHTAMLLRIAHEQRKDVDYFMKTHTVTDNGFDIVARYGEELNVNTDSVRRADSLVALVLSKGKDINVRLERRYFTGSYKGWIECRPVGERDGLTLLRLSPTEIQDDVVVERGLIIQLKHSRMSSSIASQRLVRRRPKKETKPDTHIDSLGTYTGARDSVDAPNGYGRFVSSTGDFYEGEWKHGKREGVGFSMIPGKRLMLGEWRDDKFLGERITYTPERIYGIDISRFQHEDGKKRYDIDWKNLRITSLGKISRKKIHGVVNYPITFIYIKATEGVTVKNKYFPADYVAARRYGYRVGAYHFFSTTSPGRQQAAFFIENNRFSKGDLPPVLDIEPSDAQIRRAGGIDVVFKHVRDWVRAVESRYGKKPILYISQSFVNKYLPKAPDLKKNYDVWIARYGEYKPDVNLVYWQLSPDGRVNGIHGDVDINVYNGFVFPN